MSNDSHSQSVSKYYCLITLTAQIRETSLKDEAPQFYTQCQLHLQLRNREQPTWRLEEIGNKPCQPLYSSVASFPSIHNEGMRKASALLRVQHEQAVKGLSIISIKYFHLFIYYTGWMCLFKVKRNAVLSQLVVSIV